MKCAHEGCNCREAVVERNGRLYCSEACASAGKGGEACGCGHPGCR